MREILFRGKRYYDEKWVFGLPCYNIYKTLCIQQTREDGCCPIIPETIGQYTGLTDKNGKKIFEGDILKGYVYPFFNEKKGEFNYFAEVVWFENSPAFGYTTHKNPLSKVKGIGDGDTDYLEVIYSNCWEVIGNIHDNSELIGGDKE